MKGAKRRKKQPTGLRVLTENGTVPAWVSAARMVLVVAFAATIPTLLGVKHGNRLLWTVVIPLLPLFWIVGGYHLWRRICPLAVLAQAGRFIGFAGSRRPGKWLAKHYMLVQLSLLIVAFSMRLIVTNGSPGWLVGFLAVVIAGAIAIGFVYTGKTWCNYVCPVGFVEKVYTEPSRLAGQDNSQCSPCTACKKNCPDIDLEQGYWREMAASARRVSYFFWPGVVFAFYFYYYLVSGGWDYYFSGTWTYELSQPARWLEPGFTFATAIPVVVAAPLTLLVFGGASFAVFVAGERVASVLTIDANATAEQRQHKQQQIRHRALVLAGFVSFNIFYLFGGQPSLREAPGWVVHGFGILVVFASAAIFFRRWGRTEDEFVREKFARGFLKRWQWDERVGDDVSLQDVYLLHTERTKQRGHALTAYKETVRDLVADGVVTRGELVILDSLRAQLGISDKEHAKVLAELSDEDRQLFDPAYQGSVELRLQQQQYDRDLQQAIVAAARAGHAAAPDVLESIRVEHGVDQQEHVDSMARLLAADGPIMALYRMELSQLDLLASASAATRSSTDDGTSTSLDFLQYVCRWRSVQHVDRALLLLATLANTRIEPQTRDKLLSEHSDQREQAAANIADAATSEIAEALVTVTAKLAQDSTGCFEAKALVPLACDASPYLRAVIALVLSRFDDDESRAAVLAATDDQAWLVREAAFRSLGARGRMSRELMAKGLNDTVDCVRQASLRSADAADYATLDATTHIELLTGLEKMMLVRNVPILRQLEPDDLEQIINIAREQRFAPEQYLCKEGDTGEDVYLLVSGEVEVFTGTAQADTKRLLSTLGDGACIGEMAVFADEPRSATVRALTQTRALVLPGDEFKMLMRTRPAIAQGIIEQLVVRMRDLIATSTR